MGVMFDKPVEVRGQPELDITVGTQTVTLRYISLTRENTVLNFAGPVHSSWEDRDGISVAEDSLDATGADITAKVGGHDAVVTHAAVPANARWRVNFNGPTLSHIHPISFAGNDGIYHAGDKIQFAAYFTEDVTVTGTPKLEFHIASADTKQSDIEIRYAEYHSSSFNSITFEYTVVVGDTDDNGVSLPANPVDLNGGSIVDSDNNAAHLTLAASDSYGGHMVQGTDTTAPTIFRMEISSVPSSGQTYGLDDDIDVAVFFSEPVTHAGSTLDITIGSNTRTANFYTASGGRITYRYTVVAADSDSDGVSIPANAITAGSGGMKDSAHNDAVITHAAIPDDPRHMVEGTDTIAPRITSIDITSVARNGASYVVGEVIEFRVRFSEDVSVDTGTRPTLNFLIAGVINKVATFSQQNDDPDHEPSTIIFEYTVEGGDVGFIGVPANAVNVADADDIQDSADNNADLSSVAIVEINRQHVFGPGGV